jgi:hypothetical protein
MPTDMPPLELLAGIAAGRILVWLLHKRKRGELHGEVDYFLKE